MNISFRPGSLRHYYEYHGQFLYLLRFQTPHRMDFAETDEQGLFYGYKVLQQIPSFDFVLRSPVYHFTWKNGEMESDRDPETPSLFEGYFHGIHFTKSIFHNEIFEYWNGVDSMTNSKALIVKCALSGKVLETEFGFRAQKAQIIGVLDDDGHWKSYQEMADRYADPRHSARAYYEENWRRRERRW